MSIEFFDVVIVGAGLSGIGAAVHLTKQCPNKRYVILESRAVSGGTWDLFRYPGIRSDSDMYTLGYSFKPWRQGKAIADGPSILEYVRETADENAVSEHIRYHQEVASADWCSSDACWTVSVRQGDGVAAKFRCNFLLMCAGYYRYDKGHTPDFHGIEKFKGRVVHPQNWPADLDYSDRKVVVIGSGATAMTLVPEMAKRAKHVVMLQRSPTYVISRPDRDWLAGVLNRLLPEKAAYAVTRAKNTLMQQLLYRRTRTHPAKVRRTLLRMVRKALPSGYDVDTHFTPTYDPWDQRLCLIPNGDLFQAISDGSASVITDEIEDFTEHGITVKSGESLEADILVTATGLNLLVMGGVQFSVDSTTVDFSKTISYKGMMYSDVPNLVSTFGYINASWTLRADLTAVYVCRLINHMDALHVRQCTPKLRDTDSQMVTRPWIQDFSSGYMQRMMHLFPRQGDREPWLNPQNYAHDKKMFRQGPLEDGAMQFTHPIDPPAYDQAAA